MVAKSLLAALGLACWLNLSGPVAHGGEGARVKRDQARVVEVQGRMCCVVTDFFTGEVVSVGDRFPEPFPRKWVRWPGVTVGDRTYRLADRGGRPLKPSPEAVGKQVAVKGTLQDGVLIVDSWKVQDAP